MSGVIKARAGTGQARIRPLMLVSNIPSSPDDGLNREIIMLRREIQDRDARILELEAELKRVAAEQYAKGEAAGFEAAEDRQAKRLEKLTKAIEAAQQNISEALVTAERIAILVAKECLDKMFGDKAHWPALVSDLVRHQIAQVSQDTLLKVEVAAEDFADDACLPKLAGTTELIRSDISSGSCKMTLRFGEIDAGLAQQWDMLERRLCHLADGSNGDVR